MKESHYLGRPSKYSYQHLKNVHDFYLRYLKLDYHSIPFLQELALECGVDTDTLNNWSKRYELFGTIKKRIMDLQRLRLMQHTLFSEGNIRGSIYLLRHNHGLKDY